MASDTETQTPEPATTECVILAERDGTVRWASPSAVTVFGRDPDELRDTTTVQSLLGPTAPDPSAVGADPVSRRIRRDDRPDLSVTAESRAEESITVYRCRPVSGPDAVDDVLARVDDAVVAFDTEWRYTYANDAAADLLEESVDDLLGEYVWDVFPEAEGSPVHEAMERAMATQESESLELFWAPDERYLDVRCFPSGSGVSLYFRNITERKRDEQRLAAQRDELQRLNHINELIREVNRAVVGATDREQVEAAVCAAFGSEGYPVALTARRTATEALDVGEAVGLPADLLEQFRASGTTRLEAAMRRATDDDEVTVLTGLQSGPDDDLRALARSHDIAAFATIPICADGVAYGVLTVGARDAEAFGTRERDVFRELGDLLGAAIAAIRTKKLVYAGTYQELTLAASARDAPVVALHDRLDRPLTLDGVVPTTDGRYFLYLAAEDVTQAAVEGAIDGLDGVVDARVVDATRRPLLEVVVDGQTAVGAMLDAGGRLQDAVIEDGIGEFVVDVPLDTDVRAYLARVEQRGSDMGLLAKREVERTAPATWETATTDLTPRQRTVLEAAYRSGYFDWPRRQTTGEELAESLDIASSTLHQHLRVATRKALDEYFDVHSR